MSQFGHNIDKLYHERSFCESQENFKKAFNLSFCDQICPN